MKIWYFESDTLLVEYEGCPYKVMLDSDEPPILLDTVPEDDVETAFERFMKFSSGWYYGRVIPKPKTTAKRVEKIFDTWKKTEREKR